MVKVATAQESISPAFPGRAPWGTASALRAWQQEALDAYLVQDRQDFLAVATPGAGKTTFALRVASELLARRTVERIIVVTPTEHLKVQWADAAARVGIHLDPGVGNTRSARSRQFDGICTTYAGVAMNAHGVEARCRGSKTLVILDEVHHAGHSLSWGDAVRSAFEPAVRRLLLTGTPFRSDINPIPYVSYDPGPDGIPRSTADYAYGYAEALRDHVVRPVVFMAYGGPMRWRTKAGDEVSASLNDPLTKDVTAQAWRTALDPNGEWIGSVLHSADRRLDEVRRHVPDAAGLVIATDQTRARAYARLLTQLTGEKPALVLSDDAGSSRRIEAFREGDARWLVAVRMVSEGVDVPRLAVGVYATATSTPLFFAQAVGRFVRARRRGELATVFLPTVPVLLAHAAVLERERDHVLGRRTSSEDLWSPEEDLLAAANREQKASDDLDDQFAALESEAVFDHVLFDSQAYGMHAAPMSADEQDYLGLPGLLEPDQVSRLLTDRQRRQIARRDRLDRGPAPREQSHARALEARLKELNSLVAQYARVAGVPHAHIHADLRRRCGGPSLSAATTEQVEARIAELRKRF
ncbi:MAG: DEAD/DEAH box helicase [Actinobacteria bacterium]|nr:DEAD/DEAH box helicase [Actinomycetota bacterium]